ncbi:MFS transporter [Paenibacillus marchantiae]|uniref:MFS transporter n=1 Tax=Paenibacillus marchantiae TaxID=3026433 RepID=UPI00237BA01E|nr:MFS transporter [Paenibacillus marchantiae]WDQ32172.1 MFS transporter [Paenibacillus marchantiae]
MDTVSVTKEKIWGMNFFLLFLSRFAKVLADNITLVALLWLVVELGGDAKISSIISVCMIVPQTLLGPFLSPLLQKGKLKNWMFVSDFLRGFVILVIPVLLFLDLLSFWILFILVLLQSTTGAIYNPASVALLPKILGKTVLQKANATLQSSYEVITLIGLACAGPLISLLSTKVTLLITSILFLLSGIIIFGIKLIEKQQVQKAEVKSTKYFEKVKQGFSIVKQHKLLLGLSIFALFLNIGLAPWTTLLSLFSANELNGDATTVTLIRASAAFGALVMGLVLTKLDITRQGALFIGAGILQGLMLTLIGSFPLLWLVIGAAFIFGICTTAINVPEIVIIQTTVPEDQQAQIYAVIMTISVAFLPIGYLLAGLFADIFGNSVIIAFGGVAIIISGILVKLFTPLFSMRIEKK